MSASLENNCESVIAAILGASADLLGFSIVHRDEDGPAEKDRIVVNADPREVELPGQDPGSVVAWRIMCHVEIVYVTRAEATYDTKIAAIEAALNAASPPTAAQGLWLSSFPSGARLEQTNDGEDGTDSNTRSRSRTFRFIVMA